MDTTVSHQNFDQSKYTHTLEVSGANLDPESRRLIRRMEFSAPTKYALAARVGYKCSICHHETIGPGDPSAPDSISIIGEAAHICGAVIDSETKSPRARIDMTPEECANISNGIWLCCNCHKHVDTCTRKFGESELRGYKAEAEALQANSLILTLSSSLDYHFSYEIYGEKVYRLNMKKWTPREWCLFCFFVSRGLERYCYDDNGFPADYRMWLNGQGINIMTAGFSANGNLYSEDFIPISNNLVGIVNSDEYSLFTGDKYDILCEDLWNNYGPNFVNVILSRIKA